MNALAAVQLGFAIALGATAAAQSRLVLHVRDPAGNPVKGAEGVLRCPEAPAIPALTDMPAAPLALVTGTSDDAGVLRFPAGAGRAGSGVVTTTEGLGALIVDLRPGEAQRLEMVPMAKVTTATETEPFSLWARAHFTTGAVVTLPPLSGTSVRLPAGDYEVWARNADGWIWQRLFLRSGATTTLQFTGTAQRVRARNGAWIHPAGWSDLPLVEPGGECVLLGTATAAPLTAGVPAEGLVTAESTLPLPPPTDAIAWPPPALGTHTAEFELDGSIPATAAAELFSLRVSDSGAFHVIGAARADAERRFVLPAPGDGDHWLLLVAADRAPLALPWSLAGSKRTLLPPPGAPLHVRARFDNGDPAIDVVVEWVPQGAPAAAVCARTDARGVADLGRVAAPGALRASDPRCENAEVALEVVPAGPVALTLSPGESIDGIAHFPDGTPAVGAAVTLRDPTAVLRPASRAVAVGADGSFSFGGLPEQREFVLFATTTREGRTWSGRLGTVRAGREGVDLLLRDEDPVPFRR